MLPWKLHLPSSLDLEVESMLRALKLGDIMSDVAGRWLNFKLASGSESFIAEADKRLADHIRSSDLFGKVSWFLNWLISFLSFCCGLFLTYHFSFLTFVKGHHLQ